MEQNGWLRAVLGRAALRRRVAAAVPTPTDRREHGWLSPAWGSGGGMRVNGSELNGTVLPRDPPAEGSPRRPPWVTSTLATILIFTIVVDLLGNFLVILSVYRNKKLRNAGKGRRGLVGERGPLYSMGRTLPRLAGRSRAFLGLLPSPGGAGCWDGAPRSLAAAAIFSASHRIAVLFLAVGGSHLASRRGRHGSL